MSSLLRFRPVHKAGTVMQLRVVVHELHIARLQLHSQMQFRIVGERVEVIQCLDVFVSQSVSVLPEIAERYPHIDVDTAP